jgi:glycosyltransferase involved in cell wall biosynthesis
MRVVLILDWFLYYTVELANALADHHDIMLVTRDHNYEISSVEESIPLDDFLDECLDKRIKREKLRYSWGDRRNFREIGRVYREVQRFRPDVIHLQENKDWRILCLVEKWGFSRTVLTVHDVVAHPGHGRQLVRMLKRWPRQRARKIIIHGKYLKKHFVALTGRKYEDVHVIPHGAFSIYKKWDVEPVQEEPHTILFLGRIVKYKGLEVLIEAQPAITKDIPDAKIIIAGKGQDFTPYRELIKDESRFEIHNRFIANQEIPRFFRRASLVVLPYTEASQSGIIPIAYVFGKPVVVTDVGSIPEVVDEEKTGYIVPPNDPQKLAQAIIKVLKDPELRQTMGHNAAIKASTDLSWEMVAQKTTEVYSIIKG